MSMASELKSQVIHPFGLGHGAEASDPDPELLGGKGASLISMSRAGLPVPPGFVIPVPCCRYYHEHNGEWPEGLEEQLSRAMEQLEEELDRRFGRGPAPLLVSVRSGAARSMPGMMDTILNCGLHPGLAEQLPDTERFWTVYETFVRQFGRTVAGIEERRFEEVSAAAAGSEDHGAPAMACIELYEQESGRKFPVEPWATLKACINAVFASWNNERARIYRSAHNLEYLDGTAVTVQAMFDSEVSGIAFTANPSNPTADEIIIESAYGLGESIVSGDVAPDRFVVDSGTHRIKQREIGRKEHMIMGLSRSEDEADFDPEAPSLNDEQIGELVAMGMRVEEYFGYPVDIEWGIAGGRLALLQSRAIRGLDVARDVETGREQEIIRLKQQLADRTHKKRKIWVTHNLAETLTAPTTMTWDIIGDFMKGDGGFGRMYQDLGYRPSKEVREEGFLELICGNIYADVDRAAKLFWDGMPFEYDHEEVLNDQSVLETAPTRFEAANSDGSFLLRLPGFIAAVIRSARITKQARAEAYEHFENEMLPPYLARLERWSEQDLASLPTGQLIDALHERIELVMNDFGKESLKPGFFGGLAQGELEALLTQLLGPESGPQLCRILSSGFEDSTVRQNRMLYDVAREKVSLETFLQSFGHRAVGEMELARPRWREDPGYLKTMIQSQRNISEDHSPEAMHARNRRRREESLHNLPKTLADAGAGFMYEKVAGLAEEARKLLPYRETGKHYLLMGFEAIRNVLLEFGRRWEIASDVFHLHLNELPEFEHRRDALMEKIQARSVRREAFKRLDMPDVIDSRHLDDLGLPRETESADELDAFSLSPGTVTGTARIIRDPSEALDLPEDCILVCPSTDPAWTALFTAIRGLIVERGGVLSHGAITARDFSIPAVSCSGATRTIPDGARIRLDGDRGHVTLIEE